MGASGDRERESRSERAPLRYIAFVATAARSSLLPPPVGQQRVDGGGGGVEGRDGGGWRNVRKECMNCTHGKMQLVGFCTRSGPI